MPETPESFAETTDVGQVGGVLDDALGSLSVAGSLLLRETYAAPWAIAVPAAEPLRALLGQHDGVHVVAFHLVEFGHCELRPAKGEHVRLRAGEMAVCFGGGAHRVAVGNPARAQAVSALLAGEANARRPRGGRAEADTALLCGAFFLRRSVLSPLLAALPPVMHATLTRPGSLHNLAGVARLLTEEIDRAASGSRYVVERLLEVLCAEVIRAHLESVPARQAGWFRGLRDPVAGRALAAVHAEPGHAWSVERLARQVSMSPSRFAARFAACVGESPMAYVAKWRMNVACRKLESSHEGIDRIAGEVGYESVAAFNRAFKKHVGLPPAAWRARAEP